MAELRQNAVTGRWVAVAPVRGSRPVEEDPASADEEPVPARDPHCPFCPGNEAELPEVLWELPGSVDPGWRCRAVPNLYAAFRDVDPDAGGRTGPVQGGVLVEDASAGVEPGRTRPSTGLQEVLIESPRHDRDPGRMGGEELEAVVKLYAQRLARVARERPDFTPLLFRNHGPGAGASLAHPHAQLVATGTVPPAVARRRKRMRRFNRETGGCLLCALPTLEPDPVERTVAEEEHFQAFVPWAPERPLEMWIVPRRHESAFHRMRPDERRSFGVLLGRLLAGLRILAGEVDYNYIVHTAGGAGGPDPALHWFAQIRPVTARMAGFEIGSGARILAAEPTDDAARLRRALDRA